MAYITQSANWWRANRGTILPSIAVLLILLLTVGGASSMAKAATGESPASQNAVEGQTFTIATDTTWAPFEFERDGELRGIDIDLINAVAENQGFNVEIDVLGFDGALAAVQAGQADAVMAGMSITDERKEIFDFSNPYFDSGIQMAVSTKDNETKSYEDLAGKTVSAKTGTEGYAYAETLGQEIGFTVTGFQDASDAYSDVTSGGSVAVFDDYPILAYGINTGNVDLQIVTPQEKASSYGMGVKKGENLELREAFNEGLKNLIEDGTYQAILDDYLGGDAPDAKTIGNGQAALGNEQLDPGNPGDLPENPNFATDTPVENGSFIIATDTTFAPFVFQEGGQNVGIDMDLIRAIAANQGFEIEIQSLGFDAALQAVQSGQADGVIAGMGITDERKQVFDYSNPYFESGTQMAVAENSDITSYEDLAGLTVAVKTGTTGYDFAQALSEEYGFEINAFQDSADMYNDVAAGNSAATFEDSPVLQYGIASGNVPLKLVTDPEPGSEYGFAVNKGENAELLAMFNEGLKNAQDSGAYQQIVDRYLAVDSQESGGTSFFALVANAFPSLMYGLGLTLVATLLSLIFAMILGILFGILKLSGNWFLRGLAGAYVNIFRGTPVLVQAFFFYFGVPAITGQPLDALTAGVITLSLNAGAYITEIVRGGVQSVDAGQMEASRSLGMGWGSSMRKVVMPQAFKIMTPNLINQLIITLKDTSLLSVLGFAELTYQGRIVIASTFRSFEIWLVVGAIYFIVIWLLTLLSNYFDRKFNK
ncbi:ABC transporter substrate-binding protein/permease [Gulosibacter molinativorax]|uniref:Amino acid ABC transporter permease n=1 Tax=Gulosibacter molinativorax TaxID=256821 RepID=A0ABT7C7Z3_9MICO|nr:ABC transporter substrate-binding protein/permease [Gulosibacter molinativorax]MDJ1370874.1 amino acid ABC transporter permease [Gulosibacter molinativorax]QUY62211.1 Glutamine ABC transporter glutamine-binding protein/permease protein [Gulosibacter molinativorax]